MVLMGIYEDEWSKGEAAIKGRQTKEGRIEWAGHLTLNGEVNVQAGKLTDRGRSFWAEIQGIREIYGG